MPTGITHKLYEGKPETLESFMLKCARQMGALIHMRDDPSDEPIRHREPSDYHLRAHAKALEEWEMWKNMTVEEAAERLRKNLQKDIQNYQEEIKKRKEMYQRYNDMLVKVEAWVPPTPEHEGLKDLAIRQLKDSISHDCSSDYYERMLKETHRPLDPEKYLTDMRKSAYESVDYHAKKANSENDHVDEANRWIDELLQSFDSASAESKTY